MSDQFHLVLVELTQKMKTFFNIYRASLSLPSSEGSVYRAMSMSTEITQETKGNELKMSVNQAHLINEGKIGQNQC